MANWIAAVFFALVGLAIIGTTMLVAPWASESGSQDDRKFVNRALLVGLGVIAFGVWLAASA